MEAPLFLLPNIVTNDETALKDFKGKVVLLTFWVSWCPDCQRDLEHKQRFYEAMETDELKLLMINVTGRETASDKGKEYYIEKGFTFPSLMDHGTKTYDSYQCMSVPTTFLLNRELQIVRRYNDKAALPEMLSGISEVL